MSKSVGNSEVKIARRKESNVKEEDVDEIDHGVSKLERLRKVQQRIQMRLGVCKLEDVMKNVNSD